MTALAERQDAGGWSGFVCLSQTNPPHPQDGCGERRFAVRAAEPAADRTFRALGTNVRLIATGAGARGAVSRARRAILDYHRRLSRFDPASELSALNCDPRPVVPASALLRSAIGAALWAAEHSGGLVDPCLLDALEAAGYAGSFERVEKDPHGGPNPTFAGCARDAGARPAAPDPRQRWRAIRIDERAGTIARPPGLRLDLGGSGKGHVADLVARELDGLSNWVVDCGGDIRVGGGAREVLVAHPLSEPPAARLWLDGGAIATSSIVARSWRRGDGRRAHHLLDPSTGEPVRTGILSATALAPTTLHAETLAKVALLRGPAGAREVLAAAGGLIVHEDGGVECIGPLPTAQGVAA